MASKNTEADKELTKLLERFAQEYHAMVLKETVTMVALCAGASVLASLTVESIKQHVREVRGHLGLFLFPRNLQGLL